MKAQAEPVDLIGIAAVILVMILISAVFERDTIFEALRQVATYTGKAVAYDIAGMLTISAAAPNTITINYYQNPNYLYTVDIKDRTVSVMATKGNVQGQASGKAGTLINLEKTIHDCNIFLICKKGGQYEVECNECK